MTDLERELRAAGERIVKIVLGTDGRMYEIRDFDFDALAAPVEAKLGEHDHYYDDHKALERVWDVLAPPPGPPFRHVSEWAQDLKEEVARLTAEVANRQAEVERLRAWVEELRRDSLHTDLVAKLAERDAEMGRLRAEVEALRGKTG